MSTILTTVENVMNSNLASTVIGGLFTFVGAWLALRHQLKSIRVQETTRLRWSKRWDVVAKTYSLLASTYLALRRMLDPQNEEEAKETIDRTWKTWKEFDNCYFECSLFLPRDFDIRIRGLSDRFLRVASDLSRYSESLFNENQDVEEKKMWRDHAREHRTSLIEGDIKQEVEQLKDDLREYLDR